MNENEAIMVETTVTSVVVETCELQRDKTAEFLVNNNPHETRVAVLENGILQEVIIERRTQKDTVGNIYKGKVERVLPGMDAAFINIGLEKNAFLHIKNITEANYRNADERPKISDYVRQGDEIIVQVLKEPMGTKGARLSTEISIPSRYVVFLPRASEVGISTRIESEQTRQHLRGLINAFSEGLPGGYIVRTAIEQTNEWAMRSDIQYLRRIWDKISARAKESPAGSLLHGGLPLHLRLLRDYVDDNTKLIRVDSVSAYEEMRAFSEDFFPENANMIEYYEPTRPIFDLYGVDDEIEKSLRRKVELKSGGHLVIDQTEAMITVDVNTGKFVGVQNHADTVFKTNLEACAMIARQLRLRNIGGIIIVDFIDMDNGAHQHAVVQTLYRAMIESGARFTMEPMSPLGLIEMTRKRTRESLGNVLCESCVQCGGRGYVKTAETVVYELIREIMREANQYKPSEITVIASDEVIEYMTNDAIDILADLEENLMIPIKLRSDPYYDREHYDIGVF